MRLGFCVCGLLGFAGLAGFLACFCSLPFGWLNKGRNRPFLSYWLVFLSHIKLSFLCHTEFVFPCHTERSEVSTNLKCEFALLKCRYFALNSKRILNSLDFSPFCKRLKMTNSVNSRLYLKFCGYFANAQYDNMDFSPFCKRLKMTKGVPSLRANFAKICVAIHEKI